MKPPAAKTVGALRKTEYCTRSVKQELRDNLLTRLRSDGALFPGIIGYDDTVIPQLCNAILEAFTSIKRAGVDLIITYFAKDAAGWLRT